MKFVGRKQESKFQTQLRELVMGISHMFTVALVSIGLGFGCLLGFYYAEVDSVMSVLALSFAVVGVFSAYMTSVVESSYSKREFQESLDEEYEWKIQEKEKGGEC